MVAETDRVIIRLNQTIGQEALRLGLDVNANLIETTPVDTGWARANWTITIGEADRTRRPNPGLAGVASQQAEQAASQARALGYRIDDGEISVFNNVPYIVELNEGSSDQAPAGFVQAAIDQAVSVRN